MARLSLCLVVSMLFGVPTCLVTSSTDFPQPVPSAPFLDPNNAFATVEGQTGVPLTKMIFVDPGTDDPNPPSAAFNPVTFSAYVQSEDNGKQLYARAFSNYQVNDNPVIGGGDTLDPSTFDDVRPITASLTPYQMSQLGAGCHQIALVVTHLFDNKTLKPVYPQDTSFLVWWILIEHKQGTQQHLASSCPPGVSAPGDGGVDAEAGGS